jgi:DeoR family glycerol-3-phosphate regulon repressor
MAKALKTHSTHREVELLDALRAHGGSARTTKLAESLDVSEETVRRTVKALAKAGMVQRVHGGVYLSNSEALSPVGSRLSKRTEEKRNIAKRAASLIPNESAVFLDVGSTTAFVAEFLGDEHKGLSVITNGIHAAQALVGKNHNRVHLAGGELMPVEGGTFGHQTIGFVDRFNIDVAVFSIDGFDTRSGFLLAAPDEADLARRVAGRAKRTIVVCDHAKFGQSAPIIAFAPTDVTTVITDKPVPDNVAAILKGWEIELIIASKAAPTR